MKSGITYPSYRAAFGLSAGAAAADYPVQNLDDKISIRRVFKAAAPGPLTITFDFVTEVEIRALVLLHHNAPADATFRYRLFDDADVQIYDSGVQAFYQTGVDTDAPFQPCTPHVFAMRRAVTGSLELSSHAAGWQVGGLEMGGFWEWQDVEVPREFGVKQNDVVVRSIEGADHGMAQFKPRVIAGSRTNIDATVEENTIFRFQRRYGTQKPFVWIWDYDDPTTWPREVFLVRNDSLPFFRRGEWPAGTFSFRFVEHMR